MAEKYFNNSEGKKTRVLLANDCKTGFLLYLWSPTCCYGVMTDYRKFHNKMVAYATKDDPINIRIDTLRDLDAEDETLFTITQPTPLGKRMTTEKLSETEMRTLLAEKTEIQWPPVSQKPNGNSMSVDIVIGRDGRVREAWSYSPVEMRSRMRRSTPLRKWAFQPQNVDGVPAQIETSLNIPFPAEYQTAAIQPEVKPIFDKMRAANNLRLEGAPGFHMKAGFHSEDGTTKGSYEETWVSPKKWRREVKLNDASVVEVRTEDAFYRTFPGKFAPRLADDVIDSLSFSLPGDNGSDVHDADWSPVNAKLGNLPVLRLSNGNISPQGKPDALAVMYFVEDKTSRIRGRYRYSILTVFNDLQPFGEKTVARKLTTLGGDVNKMEITIDTLEPAATVSEDLFRMAGVKRLFTSGERGPAIHSATRNLYREAFGSWLAWKGDLRSQSR